MIDENDAPEGYKAVAESTCCRGCAFSDGRQSCGGLPPCSGRYRCDGEYVIFIKRDPA